MSELRKCGMVFVSTHLRGGTFVKLLIWCFMRKTVMASRCTKLVPHSSCQSWEPVVICFATFVKTTTIKRNSSKYIPAKGAKLSWKKTKKHFLTVTLRLNEINWDSILWHGAGWMERRKMVTGWQLVAPAHLIFISSTSAEALRSRSSVVCQHVTGPFERQHRYAWLIW